MKRWLLLLTILILFAGSWAMFATIPLHVIGQPTSTGVLQQVKEEPFFAGLAEATGLPFAVTYQPVKSPSATPGTPWPSAWWIAPSPASPPPALPAGWTTAATIIPWRYISA